MRPLSRHAIICVAAILALAQVALAQEALTAKLDRSGMIRVSRGGVELAMIELNAHGTGWQHAPQNTATATVVDLPGGAGKRFTGALPVPNANGGALKFVETVKVVPQGLRLEYDVAVGQAMKLNGLHFSVLLPVGVYAGKLIEIARPEGEPSGVSLPGGEVDKAFYGWSGEGYKVEVAKGTAEAVTVEVIAAADLNVQDLRQWNKEVFEVRFPAIAEEGAEVTPEDRFHFEVTVGFAGTVKLEGP
ncbi:MAG: hypothetical protein ABFE07_27405 [Armatimonadia bacterium]